MIGSLKPIEDVLLVDAHGVLSLTGGGGKTSLMFHLARQLVLAGKRVMTTTTTRIFMPTADQSGTVLINADPKEVLRQALTCRDDASHITAAAEYMADSDKLRGFAPSAIRTFEESGLFDWILVEADGSASRPLKAPAKHEPAIPPNTTVLVSVAGLDVIGSPLNEDMVFRSELAGKLMKLYGGETITESALVNLIIHPYGSFKGASSRAHRFIFLNKADNPKRLVSSDRVVELLRQTPYDVAEALIVGQALEGVHVHAVYTLKKWS